MANGVTRQVGRECEAALLQRRLFPVFVACRTGAISSGFSSERRQARCEREGRDKHDRGRRCFVLFFAPPTPPPPASPSKKKNAKK